MARLLVIDTETGGTDPQTNSILSLAAVVWDNGGVSGQFEVAIVEPTLNVVPKALEINRIDLVEHAKKGVAPAAAVKLFMAFLLKHFAAELMSPERIVLVGHNIGFDVGFMRRLFSLAETNYDEVFSHRVLDTAGIIRYLSLAGAVALKGASSNEAFAHFGINIAESERHTALGDALATAALLTKLIGLGQQELRNAAA